MPNLKYLTLALTFLISTACTERAHVVADGDASGGTDSVGTTGGDAATGGSDSGVGMPLTGGTSSIGGTSTTDGVPATGGRTAACGDPVVKARYPACSAAKDQTSCEALGGRWGEVVSGMPQLIECNCSTGDEGCPCTKSSDCSLGCYAEYTGLPGVSCPMTSGQCAAWPGWGCHCIQGFLNGVLNGDPAGAFQAVCIN